MRITKIDHLIEFNEWKNFIKRFLRSFKIAKMNYWKLHYQINHLFNYHLQFKYLHHFLHQSQSFVQHLQRKIASHTNHEFSMIQIRVKIAILIFEINNSLNHDTRIVCSILNHDSRIEIVNLILNQNKKIDHLFLNHDTIANRIVFAIVNTNSQSTQSRSTQTKIFVRWI
jgi:hypothetical protein